jgi:ATP-dependent DNA helicase RecG
MTNMSLTRLLSELLTLGRETEWVEYKVNNSNPQEIGEYIAALSNSACYHDREKAYLVYGVEDATFQVVGTQFKPYQEKIGSQELENWLATQLSPAIDFTINEVMFSGKQVVVFIIDATRQMPVSFKGKAFIRIGSYKKSLDDHPERERKIWNHTNRYSFEKATAIEGLVGDNALLLVDYQGYLDLTRQPLPIGTSGLLERFEQEKIIKGRDDGLFDITNLGGILFARQLDAFETLSRKAVRVVFYQGNNRVRTRKEQTGGRGYAVGFEGLIEYINSQLPTYEDIGQAFRKEMPIYPPLAIRELVANAIIHQDFNVGGSSPMIEIFDNRIEITNPGKPIISTLRFIDHSPQSRNELLARTMRRLNICEERGSGIDKVVFECEFHQLPAPDFIEGDNYTRVILYGPKTLRQMDKQDKIRACYQHCTLKVVSGEFMTNQSLRSRFAVDEKNYSTVSRIIADAIDAKLIKPYDEDNKARRYTKYVPWWF